MADNLKKQPKKGILKNSSSFETEERQKEINKEAKWDEMNILATHHPKDKDYGHMKIEEPKTPYSYDTHDSGDEADGIDADLLAEKIKLGESEGPKALCDSPEESSEEENESPEERAKRKAFEMKRKHHYNEFAAVKLARKLMEQDEEEDGDEGKKKISKDRIEEVDEEDEDDGDDDSCNKGKDTKETKS
ncbi:Protein phosphatase inhibitor 2 [Armadillidium nasatum]|uniref:Protein phosphatase inhibitor 2 n=1 Tax=Armadillidium nasatum TaxID=96803 RepID=A0A5N5SU10_9CRUS|nr:Protein phosphatase inhibitor 2 [Armadillidium nasatum]